MVADYYGVKKPTGEQYSLPSLNRLLNVSTVWGCEKSDMRRVLSRLGLKRIRVDWSNMRDYLRKGHPVICLFIDELGEGHYSVIKGIEGNELIFNDSYWGKDYRRSFSKFKQQSQFFGNWLWAIAQKP